MALRATTRPSTGKCQKATSHAQFNILRFNV